MEAAARQLLAFLADNRDTPICVTCLSREFGLTVAVIDEIVTGAAQTLTDLRIAHARCAFCWRMGRTIVYRAGG